MAKTIQNYIDEWKTDNTMNNSDIDDDVALVWFNRYLHELENAVSHFVMENFYDEGIALDIVADQNKYDLPKGDSSGSDVPLIPEFKKLLECSIKYRSTDTVGKKGRELPEGSLENSLERYTTNQPKTEPYFRFDNLDAIRIYPTPTEDVTDGLYLRYARTDADYEIDDDETDLSLPRQYIPVILDGMSYQLAKTNKDQRIEIFKRDREDSKNRFLSEIGDRYLQPVEYRNPNLSHLMN